MITLTAEKNRLVIFPILMYVCFMNAIMTWLKNAWPQNVKPGNKNRQRLDSADPRRGTPEGEGVQRHDQGDPRHPVSAAACCHRVPSRPFARPRDDAANLPEAPPLRIRLSELPTNLHTNQA